MIDDLGTYPATQYTPTGGNKTVKITKRRVEIISSATSTSTSSEEFRLELLRAMLVDFLVVWLEEGAGDLIWRRVWR